ncbi:MAG: helix-hairpin-helix domain-containing protein [Pseudomonadota bacterium]
MHRLCVFLVIAVLVSVSGSAIADPVNVNSASAEMIAKNLDGVGITKARAIVAYRNENGPFAAPGDLIKVVGIGQRTLALNANDILVSDSVKSDSPEG